MTDDDRGADRRPIGRRAEGPTRARPDPGVGPSDDVGHHRLSRTGRAVVFAGHSGGGGPPRCRQRPRDVAMALTRTRPGGQPGVAQPSLRLGRRSASADPGRRTSVPVRRPPPDHRHDHHLPAAADTDNGRPAEGRRGRRLDATASVTASVAVDDDRPWPSTQARWRPAWHARLLNWRRTGSWNPVPDVVVFAVGANDAGGDGSRGTVVAATARRLSRTAVGAHGLFTTGRRLLWISPAGRQRQDQRHVAGQRHHPRELVGRGHLLDLASVVADRAGRSRTDVPDGQTVHCFAGDGAHLSMKSDRSMSSVPALREYRTT